MKTKTTSPTVKREQITAMIDRLEDLKKQATVERSHYYVGSVCTETIGLLYNLLGYYHAER